VIAVIAATATVASVASAAAAATVASAEAVAAAATVASAEAVSSAASAASAEIISVIFFLRAPRAFHISARAGISIVLYIQIANPPHNIV
jgi:hypothetical protein